MGDDEQFYESAERRVEYLTAGIGAAGSVVTVFFWGLRAGAWFAAGAVLSWLNFRWMKQGISALARLSAAHAGTERIRVPRMVYVKFIGRYVLLIVVAYVILRNFEFAVASLMAGLFVVVAAVLVEVVGLLFRGGPISRLNS